LDLAALDRFLLRRHARSRSVLVLNFHRVSPQPNPVWPPLRPELFDRLLSYLQLRCEVTSRRGMSANQNIVPLCVETGEPPLNVRMYDYLAAAPIALLQRLRIPGFTGKLPGEDDAAKRSYGAALSTFLKQSPPAARDAAWKALMESLAGVEPVSPARMMTLADVRAAARDHEIEHILLVEDQPSPSNATIRTRLAVTGDSASEVRLRALGHRPPRRR